MAIALAAVGVRLNASKSYYVRSPWFSDPGKALGRPAAPRRFLTVPVLSNSLYFTWGPLGPSLARSTGRAALVLVLSVGGYYDGPLMS